MTHIYTVAVHDREDGIYAFSTFADAQRFAAAVARAGSDCTVDELPVCGAEGTDELIDAELEDEYGEARAR
jgi:hypothetical protein